MNDRDVLNFREERERERRKVHDTDILCVRDIRLSNSVYEGWKTSERGIEEGKGERKREREGEHQSLTSSSDGSSDKSVQFFISSDGQLEMARCYTLHFKIFRTVTSQFQHLYTQQYNVTLFKS